MLEDCWWVHFYSPKLFHAFEEFRAHFNMLWCSHGTWWRGDMDRLIKPQREREQIWGQLGWTLCRQRSGKKRSTAAPRMSKVCSVQCCVWALLQSAAATHQTAKWPADGPVLWITALLCLIIYCSALSGCVSWLPAARRLHHTSFLLVHLPVPMATSTSIAIKQLQQHFQVVFGERSSVYCIWLHHCIFLLCCPELKHTASELLSVLKKFKNISFFLSYLSYWFCFY